MKILVTGSTGMIGSALVSSLIKEGHAVVRLLRVEPEAGSADKRWDPESGSLDPAALEGVEAAVHLAGDNIAEGRWTEKKKARIRDSRVTGTRLLCGALAGLAVPPRVVVSASAVGIYGDRGEEVLTEESAPGTGFLANVGREWEAASEAKGVRVVNLRFGVVLSPSGGALGKMLTPFRMCVGGRLGSGRQYMSWIALDDALGAIHHALATDTLRGPVNAVAPRAVTNLEFTKTLGRVLGRPTIFPMPGFMARLLFGQMADELLLGSTRVEPARLVASGFKFKYPGLEEALRHELEVDPR